MQKQVPAEYFFLTFTLPAEFRPLARAHQIAIYDALMRCSWDTLRTFAGNDPQLQGAPGAIAVLHTNTRRLDYHPHVDCKSVGTGAKALIYLGRYLYRGVISENDILSSSDGQVSFRYRDGKTGKTERLTVSGATTTKHSAGVNHPATTTIIQRNSIHDPLTDDNHPRQPAKMIVV